MTLSLTDAQRPVVDWKGAVIPGSRPGSIGYIIGDVTGAVSGHALQGERFKVLQYHRNHAAGVSTARLHACGLLSSDVDGGLLLCDRERWDLITRFRGHPHAINAVDYSAARNIIAAGGLDRGVTVWNPFVEGCVGTLYGHDEPIVNVMFNDRDWQLLSVSHDKTIKVWDIRNYKCVQTIVDDHAYQPEDELSAAMWNVDRGILVTAGSCLRVYAVDKPGLNPSRDGIGGDLSLARMQQNTRSGNSNSNNSNTMTHSLASSTGVARLAEAAAAADSAALPSQAALKREVALLSQSASAAGALREKPAQQNLHSADAYAVVSLLYASAFNDFITVEDGGRVRVFNITEGMMVSAFLARHGARLTASCVDSAGKRVVTAAHDGTVRMWNYANGLLLHDFEPRECEVTGLYWLPANQSDSVLAGTDWAGNLVLWPGPGSEVSVTVRQGHGLDVNCMAASGNQIVTGGEDGVVVIWNAELAKVKNAARVPAPRSLKRGMPVTSLLLVPSRETLVVGTEDGFLHVLSYVTGKVHSSCAHNMLSAVTALAVDPREGRVFAGSAEGKMACFSLTAAEDRATGKVVPTLGLVREWSASTRCINFLLTLQEPPVLGVADAAGNVQLISLKALGFATDPLAVLPRGMLPAGRHLPGWPKELTGFTFKTVETHDRTLASALIEEMREKSLAKNSKLGQPTQEDILANQSLQILTMRLATIKQRFIDTHPHAPIAPPPRTRPRSLTKRIQQQEI